MNRYLLLVILLCGEILLGFGIGQAMESFSNPLLMEEMLPDVDMDIGGQEVLRVPVDEAVLDQMARGEIDKIQLAINDKMAQFFLRSLKSHDDITTWIGSDVNGNEHAVLTIGSDFMFGRVTSQGHMFRYRPDPRTGECLIEEIDPESEADMGEDMLEIPQAAEPWEEDAVRDESFPLAAEAAAEENNIIDVMVLYTKGLKERYGKTSLIEGRIQHLIDLANDSYDNSNIHTRLRLVHKMEVDYSDEAENATALDDLTDNKDVFADIEDLRDTYGADQVTLLRRYVGHHCGLAWLMRKSSPDHAYAVVMDGSSGGKSCPDLAYTHELGHNFGCAHDRANTHHEGMYEYSYGYQFQAGDNWYRTIMAYDCEQNCAKIAYFSNPQVRYKGVAIGIAAGQENAADNARTIEQTRLVVAKYRKEQDQSETDETPKLKLSTTLHDFGKVTIENTESFIMTAGNTGDGILEIGNIGQPDAPFTITDDGCENTSLASGEECAMEISFTPSSTGVKQSSLSIISNDPDMARVAVTLRGTGVSAKPSLRLSPESVRFDTTWHHETSSKKVEIKNAGQGDLQIGQLGSSDSLTAPFYLDRDTCSNTTLAEDKSCTFVIRYTPERDEDAKSDSLDIPSNDPKRPSVTLKVSVHKTFPWDMFMPIFLRFGQMRR